MSANGSFGLTIVAALLRPTPTLSFADARAFLAESTPSAFDRAVLAATTVLPMGYAFAAAYQASLARLLSHAGAKHEIEAGVAALAVTEAGGGHPRAIQTVLERRGPRYAVTGTKSWVTLGTDGQHLLVAARVPNEEHDGHPVIRVVLVARDAKGVAIRRLAETPFMPEIPHAELVLDGVLVEDEALLPGDGYADYVKPFRTIEDAHVLGAVAAWILAWSSRANAEMSLRLQLLALLSGARAAALADPRSPEGHLVLAGLFATLRAFCDANATLFASWPDEARATWERDRVILGVGGKARTARTERALEAVTAVGPRTS